MSSQRRSSYSVHRVVLFWVLALSLAPGFGLVLGDEGARQDRLTSRPRPTPPAVTRARVGERIETGAGQRSRLALPDGSVLFVNENTTAKLEQTRVVALTSGEVYVESAAGESPFTVKVARGEVSGSDAGFAVRAASQGPGVIVTRGQARVTNLNAQLTAGQQLAPGSAKPGPAPRASRLLTWTRELMAAAESPLVPASQYAGGALIAIDPNGQEAKLSLRKYHIDVFIQDGFARTTIDQTYFNHSAAQMEGTFYFPLPADASVSHLAMYVDGTLMEAGMVERDYARQVYETIRYQRRDPALLEWVDGSTFKMRVFPIEGRQEKRVLLSYTQKLDSLYSQATYRFPAGHTLQQVRDWSFQARVKNGAGLTWGCPSHQLQATKEGGDLLLRAQAKNARVDRDVVLAVAEPEAPARFASAELDGVRYLMLRLRPDLLRPARNAAAAAGPRSWVFLFESSGDRDPLLARVQIEVIRNLLAHLGPTDTFNVLAAGTRVRPLVKEPQPVTPANVEAALSFLESSHLVGALDLGSALAEAGRHVKNGYVVHVGSGVAAMGTRRDNELAGKLPAGVHYVGVGVGKRWARSFMKTAAERTGGYFTQINPDEPIAWRCFELAGTLQTLAASPLRRIEVPGIQPRFLAFNHFPAAGEEFCAVARLDGSELPASVAVRFGDGETVAVPVKDVKTGADYLPRTWAKLEIDRLLGDAPGHYKDQIVALSKAMYVMTPFTSLLVLENDDLYTQYKVERGRKEHWAEYPAPKKIDVVTEPDPDMPGDPGKYVKQLREVAKTVVVRQPLQILGRLDDKAYTDILVKVKDRPTGTLMLGVAPSDEEKPASVNQFPASLALMARGPARVEYRIGGTMPAGGTAALFRNAGIAGGNGRSEAKHPDGSQFLDVFGRPARLSDLAEANGRVPSDEKAQQRLLLEEFVRTEKAAPAADSPAQSILMQEARLLSPREAKEKISLEALDFHTAYVDMAHPLLKADPNGRPSLLYQRPGYSGQERIFFDLVAYAPGLNTSAADIEAVLDAEVQPNLYARPGHIDAGVRPLFDRARSAGWRRLVLSNSDGRQILAIDFDSTGRFAYERTLPPGLRERVACDGTTLLHLYPQLGLASRRNVSRFHREDLATLVPWFVPPPEDLARGADLKLIEPRTVAVIPHGAESAKNAKGKPADYLRTELIFGDDGQLAEQRLVRMPKGKVLYRQVCTPEGTVRLLDGAGKELSVRRGKLQPGTAPDLRPATKDLVVLALPYRTPDHLRKTLKIEKTGNAELRFADALQLLTAHFASGQGAQAQQVFQQALHAREQRQLGLYVLLAACGQNLDGQSLDVQAEYPDAQLAQYLALHSSPVLRQHASQWAVTSNVWTDPLLQHLALSHALYQRWQTEQLRKASPERIRAERQKALDYVRKNKGTAYGWVMLCLLEDRADEDKAFFDELAECFRLFDDRPALAYAARYEHARCLYKSGQGEQARKRFRELYERTLQENLLPAIDQDFRLALLGGSGDSWNELMRATAAKLVRQKHRPAVLALARQCWQLEDQPLANHLLNLALAGIEQEKERTAMTLAGIAFLRETAQLPEADRLLEPLLADAKLKDKPGLWRLAAAIAESREQTARSLECLERALDLEFRKPPEVVDLQAVRNDYGKLLQHYQGLADAMVALKLRPPEGFLVKVVSAADRWRALDAEAGQPCEIAAKVLRALGDRELAWDYQTTPVGLKPNEAAPWVSLAEGLGRTGELDLADRAYKAAYEAEPTNAQVLWDRAQNLRRAGRSAEAQQLWRQIADGRWQPRFQPLQSQARLQLAGS